MNKISELGNDVIIHLNGSKKGMAIISKDDYESMHEIRLYAWSNCKGYARTAIEGKTVFLHQIIFGKADGHIHHINHNTYDNRRANLSFMVKHSHLSYHRKHKKEDRRVKASIQAIEGMILRLN